LGWYVSEGFTGSSTICWGAASESQQNEIRELLNDINIHNYLGTHKRSLGKISLSGQTMNIIGERQDCEKFLPKIIQKVARGEEMPIYADSEDSIGSRIYLDALNCAHALVFLSKREPTRYLDLVASGNTGDTRPDRYNICGDTELNNLELAQLVAKSMNKELKYHLVPSESARPGYDRRYALNGDKMATLGWKAPYTLDESLERIVNWTLAHPHWMV
jgi:dTDP-glucose 4,6-dehydratase